MVVKWNFTDLSTAETADFIINPNEGGEIEYARTITETQTVAPGGKTILYEGSMAVPKISFSGVILTQAEFDFHTHWFFVGHQVQLTNDLGQVMFVYITRFAPKRQRAQNTPWKMTYTVEATIVDWVA